LGRDAKRREEKTTTCGHEWLTVRQCIQHAVWGPGMAFWMLLEFTFGIGCPQGQRFIIIFPMKIAVWGHITFQTHPDFAMVDLLYLGWNDVLRASTCRQVRFSLRAAGATAETAAWAQALRVIAGSKLSVFGKGLPVTPQFLNKGLFQD